MADWKAMLDAVKEQCLSGLWSKGVELARGAAVAGELREGDEWTFRVRLAGDEIAPTVILLPRDAEWECDCEGPCDPCEHVAACAIVAAQAGDDVDALFEKGAKNGALRYELRRTDAGLVLERSLLVGEEEPRLVEGSLVDLFEGEELGFEPTREDLDVDLLVRRGEPIGFERAKVLLAALVGVRDLRLEGMPVRASAEPLFPRARVVDGKGGGVEVVIEADPSVSEVVAPGVLRATDRLHPFGAGARFGKAWEKLPFHRSVAPADVGELVSALLPEIERHIAVDVQTSRLPGRQSHGTPWLRFEVDTVEEGVDVVAYLVYGDPPVARVEDGRLVHLGGAVPKRDEALEKKLELRLRDELNLAIGRRVRFGADDGARLLSDMQSFSDGRPEGARKRREVEERPDLTPRLQESDAEAGPDLVFDAVGGADGEVGSASAESVVAAWRQGLSVVPLSGGGFGRLPSGWLERHGDLVRDLLAARAENEGRTPAVALPVLAELYDVLDSPAPFEVERVGRLLDPPADAELPEGFEGSLRTYQRTGVDWLARLRDAGLGGILADDMGLGKTVQALCVLRGRALVVCPKSVIHNWASEAKRFRPDLEVELHHGPNRSLGGAGLTLTTYETLRNDVGVLSQVDWDVVVLDEAQRIKNPDSRVARAAYELRAGFRLSLSGTPIENRLDEIWSQMHFVNRGLLGGRRDFAERYEKPILAGDGGMQGRLRARLRPFLLRRLKREVAADLPPRTESVLYCELEADERAVYDGVRALARSDLVARLGEGSNVLAVLEALLRLRQAACHPGLLPGRQAAGSSKVEALCEALEDAVADGHKALVFSQWTSFLDLVEPHLDEREIPFTRLDGSTKDRASVVDAFQSEGGPPLLLISLTAGGTGLNLTAADHVFLLDPWWNPAVEQQAADRAHRIGQDRPVMIYRLVAKDTVEERVLDLQERKKAIVASTLEETSFEGGAISREEILALLDD